MRSPGGRWTQLTNFTDKIVHAVLADDNSLCLLSRSGAPRGKILRLVLRKDTGPRISDATVVVPESRDAVIDFNFGGADTVVATRSRLYVVDLVGGVGWRDELDRRALAGGGQDVVAPVRAHQELSLTDQLDALRSGSDVLTDVGVELLHVLHRLFFVLVESEDLVGQEDVAAPGLDRVGHVELALEIRCRQVVPGRRLRLAAHLLVPAVLVDGQLVVDDVRGSLILGLVEVGQRRALAAVLDVAVGGHVALPAGHVAGPPCRAGHETRSSRR